MININPEANEPRKRSGINPSDLDAAAEFYVGTHRRYRLRRHAEHFLGRLTQSGPYEGHANKVTWKLCSNVDGNPDLYAYMLTWAEKQECVTPVGCRLFAYKIFKRPSFWYQVFTRDEWNAIDWQDVARHWNDILAEHRRNACAERSRSI